MKIKFFKQIKDLAWNGMNGGVEELAKHPGCFELIEELETDYIPQFKTQIKLTDRIRYFPLSIIYDYQQKICKIVVKKA